MSFRKKFTLTLFVMVLFVLCLTITAFASNRTSINYTDINGVTHNVPVVKFPEATPEDVAKANGYDSNAKILKFFVDDSAYTILKANDGSLTAYPTWYLIEQSGNSESYIAISEIRYGYINSMVTGKSYSNGAVLYCEFPDGLTHVRNNGVFGRTSGYERNVTDIYIPSSAILIQSCAFQSSTQLRRVFIADGSEIASIEDDAFLDCLNLEFFDFDKLTKLTFIDGFNNCSKLINKQIDLSANTQLTEIGSNCFRGCKLTSVILPDSVKKLNNGVFYQNDLQAMKLPASLEYIGDDTFTGNTNMVLESGILPKGLTHIGTNFLYGCTKLPSLIVFPVGVTSIPDEGFPNVTVPNGKGDLTIVFLGKVTKLIIDGSPYNAWAEHVTIYLAQNTISDFNGKVYSYTDKVSGTLGSSKSQSGTLTMDVSDRSVSSTSKVGDNFLEIIFCGGNGKVEQSFMLTTNGDSITEDRGLYNFDEHACQLYYINESDCTADKICFICDINKANESHNYETQIFYPNGFIASGIKSQACQNPLCKVMQNGKDVGAIFICLGTSVSQYGNSFSITQGFKLNLNEYNDFINSGNCLDFGIIAGISSVTTNSPLELTDGKVSLKDDCRAILVSQDELSRYSYFELKIHGITESYFDTPLVINLYTTDGESINYIGQMVQSDSVISTTYNENKQ